MNAWEGLRHHNHRVIRPIMLIAGKNCIFFFQRCHNRPRHAVQHSVLPADPFLRLSGIGTRYSNFKERNLKTVSYMQHAIKRHEEIKEVVLLLKCVRG